MQTPPTIKTKYEFIPGLDFIVANEISARINLPIISKSKGTYFTAQVTNLDTLRNLKSVNNVYLQVSSPTLNPKYLRKSIEVLFQMVDLVVDEKFKTVNINCAGHDSKEIQSLIHQIESKYKLVNDPEADLQINYGKLNNDWEISIRITNRPLSLRDWREVNIPGGLNPTIAHAMNVLSQPKPTDDYLNIFSGSGTLLIERAHWGAKSLLGVDINGLYNSYAIKNIKKANLLKLIQLRKHDINETPDLGQFDVITANLPFGIMQGKGENLDEIYKNFIITVKKSLKESGRIVAYTIHDELLRKYADEFGIKLDGELSLEVSTSGSGKMYPKIIYTK